MKKYPLLLLLLLFNAGMLFPQKNKPYSLSGYLTTLQSSLFDSLSGSFLNENMLHNRLNFKGFISDNITFAAEVRNRLFTGDRVRMGNIYSDLIGADNGFADMSWNVLEKKSLLLNTTIDRLWLDFQLGRFQVTAGRQRINWGQTFVWNPNDLFNAYSFFDFDYVERPGSDAVRLQYFPASSSALELAVKADRNNDVTAAGLYRFNKWSYDIQFLAGIVNSEDLVVGTGWSGSIKNLSFRGEASWFHHDANSHSGKNSLIATTGFDRVFEDNSSVQLQFMYCNNPLDLTDFNSLYSGRLSGKDLAFSEFSAFGQFTWAITPLLNTTVSAMWLPDLEGYFAGPSLDYSLAENVDFTLLWQHFNSTVSGITTRINMVFLRLKYNF
ncbi:MAG: hypothetical protein JXA72_04680 [Bacteroidales bacterium]|nr:hypothetical protein [Bacteroidales bacterium]